MTYRDYARLLLAAIRMVNGLIALFLPRMIIARFEEEPDNVPVAAYALRMFGIRTILVAADLARGRGPGRSHAIRVAPIIHASDAIAAVLAARAGKVSPRTGALIVAISGLNTVLSLLMQGEDEDDAR